MTIRNLAYTGLLLFLILFVSCLKDEAFKLPFAGFQPVESDDGWTLSSPEAEDMDSLGLDKVFRYIYREDQYYLVSSMIVIRNGKIVAEAYPRDAADRDQIQNVKSVTKSFTGILTGIALQTGLLDSLDQRFSDIYPEYFADHQDKRQITIEQALTMRTGLGRDNKDAGYDFFFTDNTVEFALSSPLLSQPGTTFYYTDMDPQLISYAIQRQYGQPLSAFAKAVLFDPLGITDWYWQAGQDGVSYGASNLNLKPRDLARFGQMLLQNGRWQDRQIVDSTWVSEATRPHVGLGAWSYGYYIWINPEDEVYWAAGHGGQVVMVAPGKNLVMVVTAWPYVKDSEPWKDNFEFSLYKQVMACCEH